MRARTLLVVAPPPALLCVALTPPVPLPENLFDQMRSCHNAATEFLRQYWSAVLPTSAGTLGPSTIAAKNAKAEKMAGYLRLTEGKVNAVINTATIVGVDPERIRAVRRASFFDPMPT